MTPIVWQDRLVKIENGCVMMSRKGKHDDFDYFSLKTDDMPLAFIPSAKAYEVAVDAEGRLQIEASGGTYLLPHGRVCADDFRLMMPAAGTPQPSPSGLEALG